MDKPKKLFARGQFARVPLIIGTVRDEFGEWLSIRSPKARYTLPVFTDDNVIIIFYLHNVWDSTVYQHGQ